MAAAAALALVACEDDPTVPNREYMPDMVSSVAFDSFAPNPNTPDGRTLMAPPEGTMPRGYEPLHFGPGPEEAARAGRELTNPIPDGPLVQQRGEVAFQRWCSPCHGHEGLGDGLVAESSPGHRRSTAEHARGLPDGRIFHIITFGQGLMPAYGSAGAAGGSLEDRALRPPAPRSRPSLPPPPCRTPGVRP